jgi:BirA family biotin operon repressor/biotin-[acetyl-CoA-carboxylase] ligase
MPTDFLDPEPILRGTFVASVETYATLSSTNDLAAQRAAENAGDLPRLIVARQQTAGRGRGANRWWTGEGSLAFSLLIDPRQMGLTRLQHSSLAAMATGLAVAETIAPLVSDRTVGIHWPNDVVADDRKLAGILIEGMPNRWQVIGIGVNVNNTIAAAPEELQRVVATLRDQTGRRHDPMPILLQLLQNLERRLKELAAAPEQTAAATNAICLQRGKVLTVQHGQRTATGRCLGIASDGALRLETPQGIETLYSGVVLKSLDRP